MANWDTIIRQVALKGNSIAAASPSALQTAYINTSIGQAQLIGNAAEFPIEGIYDCILNAADAMVNCIGFDPVSRYRSWFTSVTGSIANGAIIPIVSSSSKPRIGVIGTIRDVSNSKRLNFVSYNQVINSIDCGLIQDLFWYYTDNIRIWHTRTNVAADIVVWSKDDQRALMATSPKGACPFPEDLHEGLVSGGLAYMFRGAFNIEQVQLEMEIFNNTLAKCGVNHKDFLLQREKTE